MKAAAVRDARMPRTIAETRNTELRIQNLEFVYTRHTSMRWIVCPGLSNGTTDVARGHGLRIGP